MNESASSYVSTAPGVPGTTGTPHWMATVRAFVLSPSASIASGVGPMKAIPASSTLRANPAFSERKP
jgi:hypothetical protein